MSQRAAPGLASGPFPRLLAGHGLGTLGQLQLTMAVGVDALARTGSGIWVSIAVALGFAPYLVFSIPAGAVADRFSRSTVLRASLGARTITSGAVAAGLVLQWQVPLVILLAAATAVLATPSYPAIAAATPELVGASHLGRANTLVTGVENAAWVAGPGLFGLVLIVGAPVAGGGAAGCGFLLAGWLATHGAQTARPVPAAPTAGKDDGLLAGFRTVRRHREIRLTMVLAGLDNFLYGYLVVAIVLVAQRQLSAGDRGTGLLNAAFTAGALISMAVTWRMEMFRQGRIVVLAGLLLLAGCVAALGPAGALPVAAALVLVAGVCQLVVEIVAVTLIQGMAPAHLTGRVFGVYDAVSVGLIAAGSALAGALAEIFGIPASLIAAGALTAAPSAVLGLLLLKGPLRASGNVFGAAPRGAEAE